MKQKLEQGLAAWDGKSTQLPIELYQEYHSRPRFASTLLSMLTDTTCQSGASWLLKQWVSDGHSLSRQQTVTLAQTLGSIQQSQAKLHLLQVLPQLNLRVMPVGELEQFIRATLCDSNRFVCAWACNGMYLLAEQYPQYREETTQILSLAMQDESASIRARIRAVYRSAGETSWLHNSQDL